MELTAWGTAARRDGVDDRRGSSDDYLLWIGDNGGREVLGVLRKMVMTFDC